MEEARYSSHRMPRQEGGEGKGARPQLSLQSGPAHLSSARERMLLSSEHPPSMPTLLADQRGQALTQGHRASVVQASSPRPHSKLFPASLRRVFSSGAHTCTHVHTHMHTHVHTLLAHPGFKPLLPADLSVLLMRTGPRSPLPETPGTGAGPAGRKPCSAAAVPMGAVGAEQIKRSNRACGQQPHRGWRTVLMKVVAES